MLKKLKNTYLYCYSSTPVFDNKIPDLRHLKDVCTKLSKLIKQDDIVIFESTVHLD